MKTHDVTLRLEADGRAEAFLDGAPVHGLQGVAIQAERGQGTVVQLSIYASVNVSGGAVVAEEEADDPDNAKENWLPVPTGGWLNKVTRERRDAKPFVDD